MPRSERAPWEVMMSFQVVAVRVLWAVAVCAALSAPVAAFAKSVFVNTRYAKLRSGKTSADAELARLAYGQELTVVTEGPGFLQVKTADGKQGWVSKQFTADVLPGRSKTAESLGAAARGGSTGGVAYTAGARGLAPEAEAYATAKGDFAAAVAAVKEMESYSVPEAQLDAFLRDGKLGEFAETKASGGIRPGLSWGVCVVADRPVCLLRGVK